MKNFDCFEIQIQFSKVIKFMYHRKFKLNLSYEERFLRFNQA